VKDLSEDRTRDGQHVSPIVIVAPYSPPGECAVPVLGAARKIEGVVGVLSRFGRPLWVVNSAHNVTRTQCTRIDIREINGVRTTVITPFTLASRRLGKLGNILAAEWFARFFKRGVGLLWVYNSYAFPRSSSSRRKPCCPFVNESSLERSLEYRARDVAASLD
jgi:hypothetical protein